MKNITLAGIAEILADEIMKSLREKFESDDDRQIVGELYYEWEMRRLREERDDYAKVNAALITVNAELIENQKVLYDTNEKYKKRIDAQRKVIDTMKNRLAGVRDAMERF